MAAARLLAGLASLALTLTTPAPPLRLDVTTLKAVAALPAHAAGRFTDLTACHQAADGTWYLFDRRSHGVFSLGPQPDAAVRELVLVGSEPGRLLRPSVFDFADDAFVVADAPGGRGRIQTFLASGSRLAGFTLRGREVPLVVLDGLVLSGLGSLVYAGETVLVSQPESGALITEYALDGQPVRTIGTLRETGYEADRELHLAHNSGLVVPHPTAGFYFVFTTGRPVFRKYDAAGALMFERHVEGAELDDYMRERPTTWPRTKTSEGEYPVVRPAIRAAVVDTSGRLWISLDVPYTYLYDGAGDKVRVVQFRTATGLTAPNAMSVAARGRIAVTPGCYVFDPPK